jgi:hypothetical protein
MKRIGRGFFGSARLFPEEEGILQVNNNWTTDDNNNVDSQGRLDFRIKYILEMD